MIPCTRWPHSTVVLCLLRLLVFSKWLKWRVSAVASHTRCWTFIHTQARTKVFGLICLQIHSLLGLRGGGVGLQVMMQTSVFFIVSILLFLPSLFPFKILPPFISFFSLFIFLFWLCVHCILNNPPPSDKKKKTKGEFSLLGLRQFFCPTHTQVNGCKILDW